MRNKSEREVVVNLEFYAELMAKAEAKRRAFMSALGAIFGGGRRKRRPVTKPGKAQVT